MYQRGTPMCQRGMPMRQQGTPMCQREMPPNKEQQQAERTPIKSNWYHREEEG